MIFPIQKKNLVYSWQRVIMEICIAEITMLISGLKNILAGEMPLKISIFNNY
jgi:hypothetical protein